MATSPRIRNTPGCWIDLQGEHLRIAVGPALPDEVQDCYHSFANECVTRTCRRVLIIGNAKIDAFSHLALRDVLRSMALAGVPADFRLAVVADTANLIAVYDAAVVEAARLGLDARRFMTEQDAASWLES
jgi:hypothetical protein